MVMIWLSQELERSAAHGDILQLNDVWDRYQTIAEDSNVSIPPSFLSRKRTFRDKLQPYISSLYEIIVVCDKARYEPRTVLFPAKFKYSQVFVCDDDVNADLTIPKFKPEDEDWFLSMVHVALRIRGDILAHTRPSGIDCTEDAAIDCVPNNLYMFLNLIFGGDSLLETDKGDDDDEGRAGRHQTRILSIGQDIVYTASDDKFRTLKHVGLCSTLHQATRSKALVNLFHAAGHVMSYREVIKLDNALAERTLKSMDHTGAVVPPNLVEGRFVHFSADNVDINEFTLDGKGTFHATQVAAWQRGPSKADILSGISISKTQSVQIPEAIKDIIPTPKAPTCSPLRDDTSADCFIQPKKACPAARLADAKDMAFIMRRFSEKPSPSWTSFNEQISTNNPEQTIMGYLPIIQAPAHEIDTLNTVVTRILHVARALNQEQVVLTVDEALFPKLMELKWSVPQYKQALIPCLGGLHTSINFIGVIGRHMNESGLLELWVECGVLGANAAAQVMNGKGYARAVRAHKLTFQALWQILLPRFYAYLDRIDTNLRAELSLAETAGDIEPLLEILCTEQFQCLMEDFLNLLTDENPNYAFWWQYMDMVSILLYFIRAQRDGIWDLHLYAFKRMLPYFFRYDHVNYARWGTVYLWEMAKLPQNILEEFERGNFVVKDANRKFNQVSPDHGTEWLNATGKKCGGLVGITRIDSSLSRWTLSYNLRTVISRQTRVMLLKRHEDEDNEYTHNECTKGRRMKNDQDEERIATSLREHGIFRNTSSVLENMMNKDLATTSVQESLLNAELLGKTQLKLFVEKRLCKTNEGTRYIDLKAPIPKNKAPTFASLYTIEQNIKGKQNVVKADRSILQRLITAYRAGRAVNLDNILKHELMPVPLALATTSGILHSTNKSALADILTRGIETPAHVSVGENSSLVIDGQALVVAFGKPKEAKTFGDYATKFSATVYQMGAAFQQTDVTFDRYRGQTIKACTRIKRKKGLRPVRRRIDSPSVPLPSDWMGFLALEENKTDLVFLLSNHLIENSPPGKLFVVSGGFKEATTVKASDPEFDVTPLAADHEEADTRMILHCIHANTDSIVVSVRDTDVLILLLSHFDKMRCSKLFMKAGTAKQPKYIPVHDIKKNLTVSQIETLPAFHAITGCDSVSQLSGHGKKTCWSVFELHNNYLRGLGKGPVTEETMKSAEKFICLLYGLPEVNTCDEARVKLFCMGRAQESLPPTTDAVRFHILRAHYQASVWNQAHATSPDLPAVTDMGWVLTSGQFVPQLLSLPPIPDVCSEIVSCGCYKGCLSKKCSCRKVGLPCVEACKCKITEIIVKTSTLRMNK